MTRKTHNWILQFSERMNEISEAPSAYNIWSAISVIGGVLKNNIWLDRGTYTIFPNQYIVLIGPPGVGKGSAMHPAHAFSKKTNPPLCHYMNDRLTAPKIIERLATGVPKLTLINGVMTQSIDSSAMLYSTELSAFLGGSDWMIPFLCAAWDQSEFEYDTKHSGTSIVKNMCVSLMAGCVPDFIRNLNKSGKPETAISGGFTARAIFVFASDKAKSIVWPESFAAPGKGKVLYDNLEADIRAISQMKGECKWQPEAKFTFEKFYKSILIEEDDTDVLRNFKARQNIHVLKVAMCLSAATREDLAIDQYCINTAIGLVASVLKTLNITFRGVGESSLAEAMAKIMSYIERKGVTSRQNLIKDNYRHVTTEDLDRIIITLKSMYFLDKEGLNLKTGFAVKKILKISTDLLTNSPGYIYTNEKDKLGTSRL